MKPMSSFEEKGNWIVLMASSTDISGGMEADHQNFGKCKDVQYYLTMITKLPHEK